MAVNSGKKARKNESVETVPNRFNPIKPINSVQAEYLDALRLNDIVFATGSAGTGKTYVATAYAAELLYYRKINKIIITRPNVEAGPSLGHLPGELDEKYLPYLVPFLDTFYEKLGKTFTDYAVNKSKSIEAIPIGFLRGRSFKDCLVILDEAQNTTPGQMKLLLSRIGTNCKMIIDGDIRQTDIKGPSGLSDAINRLKHIEGIAVVEFFDEDIVRSKMCKSIITAYNN